MIGADDDQRVFTRDEIISTKKKLEIFKKEQSKCKDNEMKADYFASMCETPKEYAMLFWAFEDVDDEEFEEMISYLKDLPITKYCLEMYYNLSVIFRRTFSFYMQELFNGVQNVVNAMVPRKKEKQDKNKDNDLTDNKTKGKKKKDTGDDILGIKEKEVYSKKSKDDSDNKQSSNSLIFKESEATRTSRKNPNKTSGKGSDFGWGDDGGDNFFCGMSFLGDGPEM